MKLVIWKNKTCTKVPTTIQKCVEVKTLNIKLYTIICHKKLSLVRKKLGWSDHINMHFFCQNLHFLNAFFNKQKTAFFLPVWAAKWCGNGHRTACCAANCCTIKVKRFGSIGHCVACRCLLSFIRRFWNQTWRKKMNLKNGVFGFKSIYSVQLILF